MFPILTALTIIFMTAAIICFLRTHRTWAMNLIFWILMEIIIIFLHINRITIISISSYISFSQIKSQVARVKSLESRVTSASKGRWALLTFSFRKRYITPTSIYYNTKMSYFVERFLLTNKNFWSIILLNKEGRKCEK